MDFTRDFEQEILKQMFNEFIAKPSALPFDQVICQYEMLYFVRREPFDFVFYRKHSFYNAHLFFVLLTKEINQTKQIE